MKRLGRLLLASVVAGVAAPFAHAHFKLLEPAASLVTDDRGDPQKLAPRGGASDDAGADLRITADPFKPIGTRWPGTSQSAPLTE